jgi:tetratricopeptide (TPR) repeat protein/peroxiredoxin
VTRRVRGVLVLSQSGRNNPIDLRRREFLFRCGQGTAATFIPAGLRRFGLSAALFDSPLEGSANGEFHLHPHYRMPLPLDPLLLKTQAGVDEFITEKYAIQIAAILAQWSEQWTASPFDLAKNIDAVAKTLLPNFTGASLKPAESRAVRRGPVEVRRNTFPQSLSLGREAFLAELRATLSTLSRIETAEFQITQIEEPVQVDAGPAQAPLLGGPKESPLPGRLYTRIRYELVGQGSDLHFEQRVGEWDITWESTSSAEFLVHSWRALEETQSMCPGLAFLDITPMALRKSGTPDQLQHGTDYWRTVLDAACGIDIYGHNGVSVGDIDNDGFDDLYVCQPGGLPNRLFRNRGDGTFEDITESSGVGVIENTACALFVDVDNDGRQDLIVVRANGPLLFLNDGNGTFHQKPHAFHFAQPPQGTFVGAAVADYDRDGWLDIYFALYIYYQGASQYKYPSPYFDANNGPPNFLMRNNRDGTFRDVTAETGLNQHNTRYSFCCGWSDFNRDGWPDLYVVNDFGRKNLYRNNGDGTFTDIAAEAGVEDIGAGMSVCWFDYDNDGFDDLYAANMWTAAGERITMQDEFRKNSPPEIRMLYHKHAMGNSLFHNEARAGTAVGHLVAQSPANAFRDRTDSAGVRIGRWAWSSDDWDFDHDGFPDLYCVNGMVTSGSRDDLNSFFWRQVVAKSPDQARPSHDYEQGWGAINELIRADHTWSGYERNVFYANNGDGTFSDVSGAIGLDFIEDGRSFALADFDLDGRQELFLKNRTAPQLRILHNLLPNLPPSISFRLRGIKSNRDAIGAAITVQSESTKQTRSLQAGSGFISQHSKDVFFGLGLSKDGQTKGPVTASVTWPSGLVQEFHDLPVNHRIWIEEGSADPIKLEPFRPTPKDGWFDSSILPNASRDFSLTTPRFETWLLAPVAALDFSLPQISKSPVLKLSSLRGKSVLLHFGSSADDRTKEDWTTFDQQSADWTSQGLQLISIDFSETANSTGHHSFPILQGSDDVAAVYNILFRYLFDRHRDIDLPTSFLIDAAGEIVKVYQGPVDPVHVDHDFRSIPRTAADRLARALPYPGVAEITEFGRNYLSFGSVYYQRGYLEQAEAAFQIALRDDPESAEAMYGIGSIHLDQKKNDQARECFERALKLRASYPDTLANSWNNLGLLAGREGRLPEAIQDLQEALRLSPDHLIAMNNLGGAYRQSKRWTDAQKIYERVLALKPADADANYGLGMVYAQKGDTAKTEEYLKRALTLKPVYPEALNNLGILYLRTERRDQAVASFQESIRVAPDFDQAYLNLARVHAIEGNNNQARAVLQELLKRHPEHPAALEMLSQLDK